MILHVDMDAFYASVEERRRATGPSKTSCLTHRIAQAVACRQTFVGTGVGSLHHQRLVHLWSARLNLFTRLFHNNVAFHANSGSPNVWEIRIFFSDHHKILSNVFDGWRFFWSRVQICFVKPIIHEVRSLFIRPEVPPFIQLACHKKRLHNQPLPRNPRILGDVIEDFDQGLWK